MSPKTAVVNKETFRYLIMSQPLP